MTRVSLYVPAFQAEPYLERCLAGILRQTRPADEVLIVDDGLTDRTAAIAARFPVRVVSHEVNRGLSTARNTGIAETSGELVASLDVDCVPRPRWLERMVEVFEETGASGVGGRLIETYSRELADRWRTRHMPQQWGDARIVDPPFLFGNNTLFARSALEEMGPYPEVLRTNFEDVTASARLRAAGHRLVYDPSAVVHHLRRDSLRSVMRANWAWRFYGYDRAISTPNAARAIGRHLGRELGRFVLRDLGRLDLPCAGLSVAAVTYSVGRDVRYLLEHRGEAAKVELP